MELFSRTVSIRPAFDFETAHLLSRLGSIAVELILYDIWQDMRGADEKLAEAVLESTLVFMQAQTDRNRLGITQLGLYFEYREKDVGKA